MDLKVIGAGFGRTGTASLYEALNQLGFPCYHMFEMLENKDNKSHLDFWLAVARAKEGEQHDWQQVFAKYSAAVDNPASCVWSELLDAYPDARVILTLHPGGPEAWYASSVATIYKMAVMWHFKVLAIVSPRARRMLEMCNKLVWERAHRGTMSDRTRAIEHYHRHVADVKASVPASQLLVFSVDQGWKPLCDFLGVDVPATPFPNVNDRADFQKRVDGVQRAAYVMLGTGVLAVAAIVGLALWLT